MRRRYTRQQAARIDRLWHERQMAHGPTGLARDVWHVETWDGLHKLAGDLMQAWLRLPKGEQLRYAYPNPEDRCRAPTL
jgi:hypothetical protein